MEAILKNPVLTYCSSGSTSLTKTVDFIYDGGSITFALSLQP